MNSQSYIAKVSDKRLLSILEKCAALIGGHISIKFPANDASFDLSDAQELLKGKGDQKNILSAEITVYSKVNGTEHWFRMEIHRYKNESPQFFSPHYDLLLISRHGRALDHKTSLGAINYLNEKLSPQVAPDTNQEHLAKLLDGTIQSSHDKLQGLLAKVTSSLANRSLELDSIYDKKAFQLEQKVTSQAEELEQSYSQKLATLEEQKRELEEEKKRLDDRANTHARRDLREKLKKELENRTEDFSVTTETNKLRKPIHAACLAGLISLAIAISFSSYWAVQALNMQLPTLILLLSLAKPFGLSIAALGLLAYYIRWMNRWFDRHAEAEFKLRQFSLDIDRASWVIESTLEWRQSGAGRIPTVLLKSITHNLFVHPNEEKDEMHPGDYLASAIMGNAKQLKFGLGGAEVEMSGKDLRKIPAPKG
jgi:hypothetical protein